MSLKKGDVVALSFPLAKNLSDDIAQTFAEEQYQYYAIGVKLQQHIARPMPYDTVGVFDLRHWDCNMPEHVSARDLVYD